MHTDLQSVKRAGKDSALILSGRVFPKSFCYGASLAVYCFLMTAQGTAQELLRNSIAGETAADFRHRDLESLPYTIKSGDLRLLLTPSIGLDWNDNILTSHSDQEDDFILRPQLEVDINYPITRHNLLQVSVTFGYEEYFQHDELSTWFVKSGSQLSFDISVEDFLINLHDRFSVVQDPASEAGVADTGQYGYFQNVAGLLATWDLRDLVLSVGYDHLNYLSLHNSYKYTDHSSEMPLFQAGVRLHPELTAGVEGGVSFTSYDKAVLNDNVNYNGGVYAEWHPSSSFRVKPRFGYTVYDFDQTSDVVKAEDQEGWYFDITATHQFTSSMSYSLSGGHEYRFGISSDLIEDWYIRPAFNWAFADNARFNVDLSYEHGDQSAGIYDQPGSNERYDWVGTTFGLTYSLSKRFVVGLNYRLTLRSSSVDNYDYTQNRVGLLVSYQMR